MMVRQKNLDETSGKRVFDQRKRFLLDLFPKNSKKAVAFLSRQKVSKTFLYEVG